MSTGPAAAVKVAVVMATVVVVLLTISGRSTALDRLHDLYPFGTQHGDTRMEVGDDVSTYEIQLETPISFYDDYFSTLYVNLNGAITFDTDLRDYHSDLVLPFNVKVIAPFFADVDTTLTGNVYYRETGDQTLKDKMAEQIRVSFPDHYQFYPETLFIATWEDVGYFNRKYDLTNTFQVVIASDGRESFVAFLYPDDGLMWTQGDGKDPARSDVPAQAGFDAQDRRRYYQLPGSGTEQVVQLTARSNANVPGLWLFRVGDLGGEDIVTPAEPGYTDNERTDDRGEWNPEAAESAHEADDYDDRRRWEEEEELRRRSETTSMMTCARGGDRECHVNAECVDYPRTGGYCCECSAPFIGNGRGCIRTDEAQRISGKMSGDVNGVTIDSVDLHAYVVTTDGRTYTAISRIPAPIGYSMQGLYVIGSVLGFLFALPQQPSFSNGFIVTGGQFSRTAVVNFASTGETLTVQQTFIGQDAQGHMRMTSTISGYIPEIDPEAKIEVDDYQEEYRRVSPGVLKSFGSHSFRADAHTYHFTVDQTIEYTECSYSANAVVESVRIGVTRNFVVYAGTEQIVRFSQTNKVLSSSSSSSPSGETADPCQNVQCQANANCVAQRDTYECVCETGYQGNEHWCQDIDECRQMPGACDRNAECYNTEGSYECRCYPGYSGDGRTCREESAAGCDVLRNCDYNAQCQYDDHTRSYVCLCNDGYDGDGYQCTVSQQRDCSIVAGMCDHNAECQYDYSTQQYACRCNQGWQGDGQRCNRADCRRDPTICDPNARCEQSGSGFACACYPGYQGDGFRCSVMESNLDQTEFLLYAQGMYIMSVPFNPTDSEPGTQTLYIPGQTAVGVDVDCLTRYFYWTDVSGRTISRSRLDGTDSEVILRDLGSPEGVAVDWISKNIYWTDSVRDTINVVRFDGTNRKNLITDGLVNPRAIAVDPVKGLVFWTDWNRDSAKIEKANMDGTDRQTLVEEDISLPNGLIVDYEMMQVCWADAGTRKVECVNYDGRGRREISQSAGYPFGLALANGNLYWTDWERETTLPNMNKMPGQTPNEDVTLPLGANGRLYGITAVKACPYGSNECAYDNGGCRFLCLPTARGGRTCACPDDIEPEECNRIAQL